MVILRRRSGTTVAKAAQLGAVALGFLLVAGCHTNAGDRPVRREEFVVGGPCRYVTASGFARIMNITPEAGNVRVEFALSLPNGFRAPAWYRGDDVTVMFEGPVGPLDEAWLAGAGLVPGAGYPVQVSVIVDGTCTPTLYRFPGRPWTVL